VQLREIAEEIISVLASDPNASLDVTLEINAEFPAGVSDPIKRAVSENATSLAFRSKSWELPEAMGFSGLVASGVRPMRRASTLLATTDGR
jgi:hypothetical protein